MFVIKVAASTSTFLVVGVGRTIFSASHIHLTRPVSRVNVTKKK